MDEVALKLMRYAFPCAEISIRLGIITQSEYDRIEAALQAGKALPQAELERFFPASTKRMKEVAKKEGTDYWSMETLHAYFLKHHADYIKKGDGMLGQMMECEKDICKCRIACVTKREGEILELEEGERILGRFLPEAKKSDIVVSHRRFATEVLDPETAAKFGYRRT